MNIQDFVNAARTQLKPILGLSGSILYSSYTTLKPGTYYFLGYNPGGSEGDAIGESLNRLPTSTVNAYIDEDWSSSTRRYGRGNHPLQRNVQLLFDSLGQPLRDVCASNLIFTRSSKESGVNYLENAKTCWPVHEMIIDIVSPRVIITFGRRPFDYISEILGAESPQEIPSGHGSWTCRAALIGEGRTLIGFPHLSRYSLAGKESIITWLRKRVQRTTP